MNRHIFLATTPVAVAAFARTALGAGARINDQADDIPDLTDPGSEVNVAEFLKLPRAIDPTVLDGLPGFRLPSAPPDTYVLPDLPPVVNQGGVGSCEAESFGYGLCGYTQSRAFDGSARYESLDPSNLPSAAWLYSTAHAVERLVCPKGSSAGAYLRQMTSGGAPSLASVPYEANCAVLSPLYRNAADRYPEARSLRIGSFATFQIAKVPPEFLFGYLAAGHAIAFSGPYASGYAKPKTENGIFTGAGARWSSGHAQLLVGYDRTRNAVLVQNSFGKKWAQGGRLWWSLDTFRTHQKLAAVAFSRPKSAEGTALSSSLERAPAAFVAGSKRTASGIVLALQFGDTVELATLALTSATTRVEYSAKVDALFATGYVLVPGNEIPGGTYELRVEGATLAGVPVTYSKSMPVA